MKEDQGTVGNFRYVHDFVYGDGIMEMDIINLYILHICSSLYIHYISINLGIKSKIKNLCFIKSEHSSSPFELFYSTVFSLFIFFLLSEQNITKFYKGVVSFSLIYN